MESVMENSRLPFFLPSVAIYIAFEFENRPSLNRHLHQSTHYKREVNYKRDTAQRYLNIIDIWKLQTFLAEYNSKIQRITLVKISFAPFHVKLHSIPDNQTRRMKITNVCQWKSKIPSESFLKRLRSSADIPQRDDRVGKKIFVHGRAESIRTDSTRQQCRAFHRVCLPSIRGHSSTICFRNVYTVYEIRYSVSSTQMLPNRRCG